MIDKRWCMASACGAALMSAVAAQAQTAAPQTAGSTVEEVVVTANKRSENLMDVPVAVTAFTSQAIADKRLAVLSDLNNAAPNVRISGGDAAANPKMFIRGVGLSDFNPTTASAVGVYVDGVYIGSPFATLSSFFDLGQIEVLRGPQGTLYGKNTTGGAISITSNRPTWRPSAEGSVEYGRFKSLTVNGAVSGPLIEDKLAFRLAGQYLRDDGATLNTVTGDHVNNANRGAIRGSLLFTPSDKDEALLSVTRYANRGGARQAKQRPLFPSTAAATGADGLCKPGYYYSGACADISGYADPSADPYRVAADVQGKDRVDYYSTSLNYTHHFGGVDLVSISAFQNVRRNIDENSDTSPADILHNHFIAYQKEWSQELRLQADVGNLKWVLGAYYMRDELKNNSTFDVLRDFRPFFTTPSNPTGVSVDNSVVFLRYAYTQNTDTYALFGQADYSLTDKLTATVGLRYSADKKTFDYHETAEEAFDLVPPYAQRKSFGAFSGRLGLRYDLTDESNIYATYNRGFKSGGFFGGQADHESYKEQLAPYGNETVDAYEVGSKSSLFDRRLRLSLSAFYYDYKDLQAFAFVVRDTRTVQILDNAGSARVYGGEAEITAVPIRNLTLTGGLALLHAKYKDYRSEGGDYSGNQMPEAPKFNASLSAKYKVELESGAAIEPSLDASYRTRIFFDPSQTERLSSPAVFQLNGQLAWRSPDEHLEAGLWAKNLTNKAVLVEITPIAGLGYDMLSYAPPRTFGVFLRYHY
ncbi:TonB-dependent receptor [Caulobacter segnis]|uniref:TonB-dependent receptor n=1 Tax=Caulobacter segnis TaxID=88688 RepID=A0A2W5UVT3_9CAUL|nr:TonB-dependent receptor [Caulobacter segnis]PZR31122.1 MAG: TonB-dependent receptor [Caulobacter segnis]